MITVPASPLPRWICTPVTRPRISATFLSGNLPMSSATMESTTWSLFCLMVCADSAERRMPLTTTVSSLASSDFFSSAGGWLCAWTWIAAPRRAAAATVVRSPKGILLMLSPSFFWRVNPVTGRLHNRRGVVVERSKC